MPAAKPTLLPEWASGPDAAIMQPLSAEKLRGWRVGEAPPAAYFNWIDNLNYQWAAYLQTFEQNAFTWPLKQTFTLGADLGAKLTVLAEGIEVTGDSVFTGAVDVSGALIVGGDAAITGEVEAGTVTSQGNVAAGGGVNAVGAITGASIDVGGGAIDGGPVSGTTGTFTGDVTGASFAYAPAVTRNAYLDPSRMVASESTTKAAVGFIGNDDFAYYGNITDDAVYVRGQVVLPAGATITGIEVEASNANAVAQDLSVSSYLRTSTGTTATGSTAIAVNAVVSVPNTATVEWHAVTIGTGPFAVPLDGYVVVRVRIQLSAVLNEVRIYGVRVAYTLTTLRPSA